MATEDDIKKSQYKKRKIIPTTRAPGSNAVSGDTGITPEVNSADAPYSDVTKGLFERNWQEQCYLIDNAHIITKNRQTGGQPGPHDPANIRRKNSGGEVVTPFPNGSEYYYKIVEPGKGCPDGDTSYDFDSDWIANAFSKYGGGRALYTATPDILSSLVPYIRIWKVHFDGNANAINASEENTVDAQNSGLKQLSVPMDFNIHTTFETMTDIFKGTSGKTDDVGLKSFRYGFHGGDMITKEILKCDMVLHFNSIEGLVKLRTSYVKGRPVTWQWINLIYASRYPNEDTECGGLNTDAKQMSSLYEIKVEIGWAGEAKSVGDIGSTLPPNEHSSMTAAEEAKKARESLVGDRKIMFLSLASHTMSFNQDGSLDLTITFWGRATSRWRDKGWELLYFTEKEKDQYNFNQEAALKKKIEDLRKGVNREKAEKAASQSTDQNSQNPGVIDLKVSDPSVLLQKNAEEAFSQEDIIFSAIESQMASGPEKNNLVKPTSMGDTSSADVLSRADVMMSERELFYLQYELQKIQSAKRSTKYQGLFKSMETITHRARLSRSELGEYTEGQLVRAEANKTRTPWYARQAGIVGASEESLKQYNDMIRKKALSRTLNQEQVEEINNDDRLTDEQRRQKGFLTVLEDDLNRKSPQSNAKSAELVQSIKAAAETAALLTNKQKTMDMLTAKSHNISVGEAAQWDEGTVDPVGGEPADVLELDFFYLGDLIDMLLEHLSKNPEFTHPNGKDEKKILAFAPFTYEHPLLAGHPDITARMMINLADIPISSRYFHQWFRKNFVMKFQDSIRFDAFFKLLMESLVFTALGEQCYSGGLNAISNLGLKHVLTKLPLKTLAKALEEHTPPGERVREDRINPSWTSCALGGPGTTFQQAFLDVRGDQPAYEYYVVFANSYIPKFLTGEFVKDQLKGIHHIFIGSNKGLMKNVKFEKIEQQSVQSYKIAASGARDVREIYKMSMSMVGNNIFEPGQLVYINPTLAGLGARAPDKERCLTKQLGLGGYYRINTVDGVIENGRFETIINGYWETFGATDKVMEPGSVVVSSGTSTLPVGELTPVQIKDSAGNLLGPAEMGGTQ